ncbi:MAG: M23 family metallopeptidase [Thermoanaerobaculia bacterium]|nr:M23 family metallopeptidase [Thermoanaerobaculia bacterium]
MRSLLVLAALLGALGTSWPSLAQSPCDGQGQSGPATEISGAGFEMPVPNTGQVWNHAQGSPAHVLRDTHALDLNENATSWDFDNGLPVLAAAAGTVRYVANDTSSRCTYGWNVMIEHGSPIYYTHYAHLAPEILVANGQKVVQGQVIGYVSNTGTSASHLHWSVRQGTTAKYASVNGQSTANANTNSLSSLTSDTRMVWFDDFNTGTWDVVSATGGTPTFGGGYANLPADSIVRHRKPIFVRSANAPYRLVVALRAEKLKPGFVLAQPRLECYRNRSDATPSFTALFPVEYDTSNGWAIQSIPVTFGTGTSQCPTDTRFVKPVLYVDGDVGTRVQADFFALLERPDVGEGGNIRLHSFSWGGIRRHLWSIQDRTQFTNIELYGSNQRDNPSTLVRVCSFALGTTGFCNTDAVAVNYSFYFLKLTRLDGRATAYGPVGPVDPSSRADIPGLGPSRITTLDFRNIPTWTNYPYQAFDGVINTYGIINYAPNGGIITFTPDSPKAGLRTFEAYYGGNTTRSMVYAVDDANGNLVLIGDATNTSLGWTTITNPAWPARTREVLIYFQRTNPDYFLHIDEIRFR